MLCMVAVDEAATCMHGNSKFKLNLPSNCQASSMHLPVAAGERAEPVPPEGGSEGQERGRGNARDPFEELEGEGEEVRDGCPLVSDCAFR